MPIEHTLLIAQPEPLEICPNCKRSPFRSDHMRGMVQKAIFSNAIEYLKRWWNKEIWRYCAIICNDCCEIVGYEAPPAD